MIAWRGLVGLAAFVCSAAIGSSWIVSRSFVPPQAGNESKFLRTYNPIPLLKSFRAGCPSALSTMTGSSSTAGFGFLTVAKDVQYTETVTAELCDDRSRSILTALNQSLLSGLGSAGCQVSSDELSAERGVRIAYRCGARTAGLVTIGPLIRRSGNGIAPFVLTLKVGEHWSVAG